MNKRILITSTNSVEGAEIENYAGLISTNVVVGTNFFSDFGASITDIFGGHSASYQRKLQGIYNAALDGLKEKAELTNSNAIIGLNIDFDEISGKGKSMFMISAMGTAVRVKYSKKEVEQGIEHSDTVSLETLNKEISKRIITTNIDSGKYPSEEDWDYLVNNPIKEIAEPLIKLYFISMGKEEFEIRVKHTLVKKNFIIYLKNLDSETAKNVLYHNIKDKTNRVIRLLTDANLFSISKTKELFSQNKNSLAVKCLSADKKFYKRQDLEQMFEMQEQISSLENTGTIEMVKPTLGKAKEKFICSEGHVNDSSISFCSTPGCGINIKGFTEDEVSIIDSFALKIESIKTLLEK